MIRELSDWLATETGLTLGTDNTADFGIGDFPFDEVNGVCSRVRITGGPVNAQNQTLGTVRVQVVTRAESSVRAYDQAMIFLAALKTRGRQVLPLVITGQQWYINSVGGLDLPQDMGSDAQGRDVQSANYILHVEMGV